MHVPGRGVGHACVSQAAVSGMLSCYYNDFHKEILPRGRTMATWRSPALASLSRCADQIQKYLTLQDAVAPGAAMVACADRLASDLQVPRAL